MSSNFISAVRAFLTQIFQSNPDLNILTKSKLRKKFVAENQRGDFTKQEQLLFKQMVCEFLVTYSSNIQKCETTNVLENDRVKINIAAGDGERNKDYELYDDICAKEGANATGNKELNVDDKINDNEDNKDYDLYDDICGKEATTTDCVSNDIKDPKPKDHFSNYQPINNKASGSENNKRNRDICTKEEKKDVDSDSDIDLVIDETDDFSETKNSPLKFSNAVPLSKPFDSELSRQLVSPFETAESTVTKVEENTSLTLDLNSGVNKNQSDSEDSAITLSSGSLNPDEIAALNSTEYVHQVNSPVERSDCDDRINSSSSEGEETSNQNWKKLIMESENLKEEKCSEESFSCEDSSPEKQKLLHKDKQEASVPTKSQFATSSKSVVADMPDTPRSPSSPEGEKRTASKQIHTKQAKILSKNRNSKEQKKCLEKSFSCDDTSSPERQNLLSRDEIEAPIPAKSKFALSNKSVIADMPDTPRSPSSPEDKKGTSSKQVQKKRAKITSKNRNSKKRKLSGKSLTNSDVSSKEENSTDCEEKEMPVRNETKLMSVASHESKMPVCETDERKDSSNSELDHSDNNTKVTVKAKKVSKKQNTQKVVKGSENESHRKIERLKKYIHEAGIRISSYSKLFESCSSIQAKAKKLSEVLTNAGMKGNPSLRKCRALKKARELKQDAESLNTSFIISNKGRGKRNTCSLYLNTTPSVSKSETDDENESITTDDFAQIRDLVDSENESDSSTKQYPVKATLNDEDNIPVKISGAKAVLESDDDVD